MRRSPPPNAAAAACRAFSASSSPWVILVASKARTRLASLMPASLSAFEPPDLVEGDEGEDPEEAADVPVVAVDPILVEIIRAELGGVQPDRALGRLAHLGAGGGGQEREGQGLGHPALDAADEIDPGQDVAPLIVPAHLQRAMMLAIERQVVVGLEELVVELDEGQALLQPLLVGLGGQHPVDAEMAADVPEERDVVEGQEPVGVVHGDGVRAVKVKVARRAG